MTMGRRPIGETAMTDAERKRLHRARQRAQSGRIDEITRRASMGNLKSQSELVAAALSAGRIDDLWRRMGATALDALMILGMIIDERPIRSGDPGWEEHAKLVRMILEATKQTLAADDAYYGPPDDDES
jgi:hypothetical protein